jgi:viroplasmin and RNaseH domain-containing protein
VAYGRQLGIYMSYNECQPFVKGFSSPVFKAFGTCCQTEDYYLQENKILQIAAEANPF